jgi:hypothetical protein
LSSALISKKSFFISNLCLILLVLVTSRLYASQDDNALVNSSTRSYSANWVVSADFLAWLASEDVTSIWTDVVPIGIIKENINVPSFDFKWNYGFRVGLGYNLSYDQWDTIFNWTWFRTSAEHNVQPQLLTIVNPEFFAAFLTTNDFISMSAQWSILFNIFDWELGRSFWISKRLSIRPFLGIKGGWINQSIHAQYYNLLINDWPSDNSGKELVKNNFWGMGPSGGINLKFVAGNFTNHFCSLFGDFSTAAMWGSWSGNDVYKNTLNVTASVNSNKSALGALMFRGFWGLGWDININKNKAHFTTKLGYEMQLWLNQLRIATFQLQRLHGDLTLQGVTFNCRFDF